MFKRLSRCLVIAFFLWFFSSTTMASPAYAQLIGTHLGEGHPVTQVEIMRMIQSKGTPPGFPVTIQVTSDTSAADLQSLADTARAAGFFPIVRIDGVCTEGAGVSAVSSVRAIFGPEAIIAFGNEVNNQDIECKDWGEYSENLGDVLGKSNLAPSALDAYMGLEIYAIPTMFREEPALETQYKNATIKVGNAYGCVGTRAGDCDVAATDTHLKGITPNNLSAVTYLTEFSLSPESRVEDAPDTDMMKVVDFIETRGPQAASQFGIQKITPLIRNTCNDDGEWLIYIGGTGVENAKVFTKSGAEIDPKTCTATESELAPYYLYPIRGVNEKDRELMKADLYAQGYQAYCSSPQLNVKAMVNNLTDYLYNADHINDQTSFLQTEFSFGADYSGLKVPLWRDDASTQDVMSSIENYWGYLDTTTTGDEQAINSGALYTRTTLEQQCDIKTSLLSTVRTMCEGLANPDACPLYQQLPGYDWTFKDMIDKMDVAKANGFTCEAFGTNEWQERINDRSFQPRNITREELTHFTEGIRYVPFYLDKAYRLGFIVLSLELKKPIEPLGIQPFTFLRGTNQVGSYETIHEVRILAFKLPDVGTNRDPDSPIYYKDSLQHFRDTLLSPTEIANMDEAYALKRSQVADLNTHIDCTNNSDYCTNNRLVQGLVQFVNEKLERSPKQSFQGIYPNPECEREPDEIPYEEVREIFGLGNLPVSEGTVVANVQPQSDPDLPQTQADTVEALREEYIGQQIPFNPTERETPTAGTTELEYKFLSQADAEVREGVEPNAVSHPPNEADGKTKIRSYLVVPQGYQLETVEDALVNYFDPDYAEEFRRARDNQEIPLYFPLKDTGYNQPDSGFPITLSVTHTDTDYCSVDETTGQVNCGTEILKNEVTIEYQDREPNILGGSLGFLMRRLAANILPEGHPGWVAVNTCETTEDYLLGNCFDRDDSKSPNSLGRAPVGELTAACSEMYGSEITVVYDQMTVFKKAYQIALNHGIDPNLLWGIYRIEGGDYRNTADTLAPGETKTISCASTINSCGAVGPMQIIQAACVSDRCPSPYIDDLKKLVRPTSLCNIDDALNQAASILQQNIGLVGNVPHKLAGRYHGVPLAIINDDSGICPGAAPVDGCDGDGQKRNYCQCATEGFDQQFNQMKSAAGL